MRLFPAALVAIAALAGCSSTGDPAVACEPRDAGFLVPADAEVLVADREGDWEGVVLGWNFTFDQVGLAPDTDTGASNNLFANGTVEAIGNSTSHVFGLVRVNGVAPPEGRLTTLDLIDTSACPADVKPRDIYAHHGIPIVSGTAPGPEATPGRGAMVATAGFLTDGTLFYTNLPFLDGSAWPRVDWYAWGGSAPLAVYVYDQDRSEQPAEWKGTARAAGATGTGADPTVRETLAPFDAQMGLGYSTTIQGFNEGLKGLPTNAVRVVVFPPEQGYTMPGYEDHPLYGEALVFVIRVLEVHERPCVRGVATQPCVPQA